MLSSLRVQTAIVCVLSVRGPALQAQATADSRFDAIASLAEAKMKEFGVPGVALGIVNNGVVTVRGLGITNVEDPLPVTAHTVFPIASISKTFAATAMMRTETAGISWSFLRVPSHESRTTLACSNAFLF